MRRFVTTVVLTGVCAAATACTNGDTDGEARSSSSVSAPANAHASTSPPPTFAGVQHRLPQGKALHNDPDLYKTVSLKDCAHAAGRATAGGTVENLTGGVVDYSILVFFTDAQARTIDSARATVQAAPGATAQWSASRAFAAHGQVNCVVRAVRQG